MKEKVLRNYHWVIAAISVLEMFVLGGIINNLSGLHLLPVTEELQISRGSFALAFSVKSVCAFFSNLLAGNIITNYGCRRTMSIALLVSAGGLALFATSQNVLMLILGATLLGISDGFCFTGAISRIVSSWFHRHQGAVLGVVTAMTGLGGSLLCIVMTGIIKVSGWRGSFWFCAALLLVITFVMYLLLRDRPEKMGLEPYGKGYLPQEKSNQARWEGYTMAELRKKPAFYLFLVITFLSCLCSYIVNGVVVPHVQDCGMDANVAASVQSVLLLALTGAKLCFGFLSDRIGAKSVTFISAICAVAGIWMMAEISGPASAYAGAVVFSVGLTATGIVVPLLVPYLFGYRASGNVVGIGVAMISASGVVSTLVSNYLHDWLGTYRPVFRGTAVLAVAVFALYVVLFAMAKRDRKQYETAQEQAVQ